MSGSVRYDGVTGLGMIFLRRDNPVSDLILKLSNTRYNLAGFYYETNVSGSRHIKVILTDLGDIGSGKWLPPFDLYDVLSDHLIKKAVFRPFINEEVGNDHNKISSGLFREILAGIIPNRSISGSSRDDLIQEWMYYLLMGKIDSESNSVADSERGKPRPPTSIFLINSIILDISSTISRHSKDPDDSDEDDDILIRDDTKIRYLLVDLGLFDDPIHIQLPKKRKKILDRYLMDSSDLMKSISLNFTRLFLEKDTFQKKYLRRLDPSSIKNTSSHTNDIILQNLIGTGHQMNDYLISSLMKGEIDPSNLYNLIDKHDHDSNAVLSSFSIKPLYNPGEKNRDDLIRLVSVCPSMYQENPDISPNLILTSLHDKINSLVRTISTGGTPLININELSNMTNSLLSLTGLQLEKIPAIEGETSLPGVMVVSSGHESGIPIRLSDGNKIVLSLMGEDLDQFGKEDLREILSTLDVVSNGDNRFDDLRAKIVDALQ